MRRVLAGNEERLIFAADALLAIDGDVCELWRGTTCVPVPAATYRLLVCGPATAAVPEVRAAWSMLSSAGILSSDERGVEATPAAGSRLPAQLSSFRPYRLLGRGSFGSVYEAFDVERGIECALKICDQVDPESLLDFKNEVRTAWSLSHPNLVVPFQLHCERGLWFYAMELVRGRRITDSFTAIAPEQRLIWLSGVIPEIVDALETLHRRGVLHLDLTPNNIMVRDDGSAAILDFGLARWRGERPLGTRAVTAEASGTLAYMAPELLLGGEPGTASDWYSLGMLLYRLLAGELPFAHLGDNAITMRAFASPPTALRRISWVPTALALIVEALLQPRPAERGDGRALLFALARDQGTNRPDVATAPIFLGREELLHRLASLRRQTATDGPMLVRVAGPPGIGKTALVARFRAAYCDGLTLAGRCYEHEHLPFKGLEGAMDELRQWLMHDAPAELVNRMRPLLAGPARLFPGFTQLVGDDPTPAGPSPNIERGLAYQQLKQLFRELVEQSPLMICIDDVHWGDHDTVQLLVELLSPPLAPRMLVLCTHRSGDAIAESAFLTELARLEARGLLFRRAVVEVGPLDAASMQALAEHHAIRVDPRLVASAVDEAAGSPFLAEEFARYLAEHTSLSSRVPALRDMVAARVDALSDEEQEIFELISVAGRSLDERRIAAASRAEPAVVSRALITLKARSLLRGAVNEGRPTVAVYHDRVRVEAVALLEHSRQSAYHRRWIEVLEPQGAAPHELFIHYRFTEDRPRAAALAVAAAVEASASLAFGRAAEWYSEALELDVADGHSLLHTRRAEALFNAGRSAAAAQSFILAADGAADTRRSLLRRGAEAYLLAGKFAEGTQILGPMLRERKISVTRGTAPLIGSILGQMLALKFRGAALRAPAVPASEGDLEVVDACWSLGRSLAFVEPLRGVDFVLRSLRGALRTGDPERIARALAFMSAGVFFQIPGLRGAARDYLARATQIAATLDDRGLRAVMQMWDAMIEIGAGAWPTALEKVMAALAVLDDGCVGVHWERYIAGGLAVWLLIHTGEVRRGLDLATRMLGDASERGDLYGQVQFIQYTAWDQLLRGQTEEARRQARWITTTWSVGTYTVQSFYSMLIEALCDLYDGDATAAQQRWQAGQAAFRRAGGPRAPQSRIDNTILEARILLRTEPLGPAQRRRLGQLARVFAVEERSDGRAHARWIEAALQRIDGRREEATRTLVALAMTYKQIGLQHWAYAAITQASHLGGPRPELEEAAAHYSVTEVADRTRWVEVFMPVGRDARSSPGS